MDATMINPVAISQAATSSPLGQAGNQMDEGSLDFAQVLMSMQGTSGNSAGQTGLFGMATNSAAFGSTASSWLDLLGLGQGLSNFQTLGLGQMADGTTAGMDGLAEKIMQALTRLRGEGGQNSEELLGLVKSLQKELQATGGQMAAGQQMLVLLAQLSGQTLTPTLQEDGSLQLSLSDGQDNALQTLMTAPAEDVVKMLGGDKALFAQALQSQSNQAATLAAGTAAQTLPTETQAQNTPAPLGTDAKAAEGNVATNAQISAATQETAGTSTQAPLAKTTGESTVKPVAGESKTAPDENALASASQNFALRPGVVTTGNVAAASAGSPTPIATQLQEGIQNGLQQGLNEFSIKLMPEGLGEVTVRLKTTEAGLKLTLVAKSAETQRLLGAELDQLRETLRPMKVEVQEVLTNRQEQMLANQQNFQNQQQQRAWQQMHGAAYYRDEPLGGEVEAETTVAPEVLQTALDTHI